MLAFFRRRMKIILWILVVAVIVTFIPWGVGVRLRSRGERDANAAGELFGKTVSRAEYINTWMAIRATSLLRGPQPNDEVIDKRVWEHLLMLSEARREGISVSDRELARAIRAQFGGERAFNQQAYEGVLRHLRITPDLYEEWMRESLMIAHLLERVRLTAWMPDDELEQIRREEETRLTISYVLEEIAEAEKTVAVSDDEIKKYYDEHTGEFKLPPTVNARYLLIPFGSIGTQTPVTEDEIAKYYSSHPREFAQAKRVRARHILLKVEGADLEKADARARELADEIIGKLKEGKEFDALARNYSQDEKTKGKGGDLGYIMASEMPREFSEKAFAMKEGEISDAVKTALGYHIIKVEGIQEAGERPLDEVRKSIRSMIERDNAERARTELKRAAYSRAVGISLALVDNPNPDDIARQYSVDIKETGPFSEHGETKDGPLGAEFAKAAFTTPIGSFSDIIEIPDKGYCIIIPKEKTEEKTMAFQDVRSEIAKKLRYRKAKAKARELAEAKHAKVEKRMKDEKIDFASACSALSIKTEESKPFTPVGPVSGIGAEPGIRAAASKLKVGDLSAVIDTAKGSCFFALIKREEPPEWDKTREADISRSRAMIKAASMTLNEWSKWVHARARMVDYLAASAQPPSESGEESEE